jgi:hypothetical protein
MNAGKIEKYFAIFQFIFLLIIFLLISFRMEGYYGGADNLNHYLISRYSFQHHDLFFDGWGRPLFSILSSPFAQFGFYGIKVFNVILALMTMLLGFLTAKKLGYSSKLLAFVMIGFAPIYFITIFSALTEILAGFVLILSVYLFFREKYLWSAVTLSFIYFARAETMIFYPIFLAAFLFKKEFRAIPFLFTGILIFTFIGGIFFKDFLWLLHRFPYPVHSVTYKDSGPLLHFFNYRNLIFGFPQEILVVLGIFVLFFQLTLKDKAIRTKSFYELILILSPFVGFFVMHSVLYWKALGGSVGYLRVITSVIPLSALVCLKGYGLIDERLKQIPWLRYLAMIGIGTWIIFVNFKTYEFPFKLDDDEKVIKETSEWLSKSEYAGRQIFYADVRVPFYMNIDPFNTKQSYHMYHVKTLGFVSDSSLVVWDAHFGPNESGIPLDSLLLNKRFKLIHYFEPQNEIYTLGGKKYEIMVFMKLPVGFPTDNIELLKSLKENKDKKFKLIDSYINDFEKPIPEVNKSKLSTEFAQSGKYSYLMDGESEFSPGFQMKSSNFNPNHGKIKVKVSLFILSQTLINTDQPSLVISLNDEKRSYDYNSFSLRIMDLIVNKWTQVEKEIIISKIHSDQDFLKVYIYNPGKKVFYIDDLKVDVLESVDK